MSREPVGTFCLVLHSHLPWLARHGAWPVGEEWLYQAWAGSYQPVLRLLRELAAEGRRDVLTLGVTPVLAAQLDDPYCLRGMYDWLGSWLLRSHGAGVRAGGRWRDPAMVTLAADEHRRACAALADFEQHWRHGGSPVLRPLVDSRVIELIGGPATHPFQPLLDPRIRDFALRAGLTDTHRRLGSRPAGIWAPECGYAPGMEDGYAAAGVQRFLVDGPALRGDTALARTVGDSDVVCFGRDLPVTYRVWSPRSGYPGRAEYRDFHTYDHSSGLKPSRVTGRNVPTERKKPYDPALAAKAIRRDAADFVKVVQDRLTVLAREHGRPALVVAAYDTELFGHWWFEGPAWLGEVLRALPEAGVRVSTLGGALETGLLGGPVALPASSWGSGKDWRVWDGERVAPLVEVGRQVQDQLLGAVDGSPRRAGSDRVLDGMARQALLALSSDWAFMVTKDSAADYSLARAHTHASEVASLAALIGAGQRAQAGRMVIELDGRDTLFGGLDARGLAAHVRSPSREPQRISLSSYLVAGKFLRMRVLIVSWEYPPVVVGGLGRHVHALARRLAVAGHDVRVLSRQPSGTDATTHPTLDETVDGVRVLRVAEDPPHLEFERDMVAWTLGMSHAMLRALPPWLGTGGSDLLDGQGSGWRPDVVHAHDWLVAHAAITIADLLEVPLVATMHATEAGRHAGWLSSNVSQQVHSVEWWLAQRADALITCSQAMRVEAAGLFERDESDITVLHNGIEPRRWLVDPSEVAEVRARYAPDGAPLLAYFGRLEYEKGLHDLIAALPRIRRAFPGTRLLVAGQGTQKDFLVEQARIHRVRRSVLMLGHLPDHTLAAVLAAVRAVVLPSRYEPFGMVALETAAAGAPLVASTAGGLGEVVRDGVTGVSFTPGDVPGIASAVCTVLGDPAGAARRAVTARARLTSEFDWDRIAEATAQVYARARRRAGGPLESIGRPKIPTGNVFGPTD